MDRETIAAAIQHTPLFSGLDGETVSFIASAMQQREVPAGAVIYKQDAEGDSMLVVLRGSVGVRYLRDGGESVPVSTLGPGAVLGELSFLDPAPRAAQVEALEPCTLGIMDRMVLQSMYSTAPAVASSLVRGVIQIVTVRARKLEDRILAALKALGGSHERLARGAGTPPPPRGELVPRGMDLAGVPLPPGFAAGDLETLAGAGRLLSFGPSDDLCLEGERGLTCFIVIKGAADVLKVKGTRARRLARLEAGSVLGQIALVADVPRTATVRAADDLVVLELSRDVFQQLLGARQPLAIRFQEQIAVSGIRQLRTVLRRLEHVALTPGDASESKPAEASAPASASAPEPAAASEPAPRPTRPRRQTARPAPPAETKQGVSQVESSSGLDNLMDNLDSYLASLGEWGITEEELDAAEVAQPDGLMSGAERKARLRSPA